MTNKINETNVDLKKDNGLFDDVWDIRTQDQKIIDTVKSNDTQNKTFDNDWDSLLDYYEPSRKVIQVNDTSTSKPDHTNIISSNVKPTIKPVTKTKLTFGKPVAKSTTKPIQQNDNENYDEYDDEYDDTYDNYY